MSPKTAHSRTAHSTGKDWHLKGEGVVCCPCAVPCPCRTNGRPTYGHCEATLYLHWARDTMATSLQKPGRCGYEWSLRHELSEALCDLSGSRDPTGSAGGIFA